MGLKLRRVGHLFKGDSNKIRLTVVLLLCLLLTALAQPLSATTDTFKIYLAERGSTDANDGSSWSQSIRTLQQAYEILQEEKPDQPVEILIGPGEYRCRGMEEPWRFFNGHPITIKALGTVPSPAVDSENHPNRPVFWGIESDGSVCETRSGKPEGNLLTIVHPRIATHITVQDIKITRYRGGITVTNQSPKLPSRIDQDVTIDNVAFVRIGDAYQAWWGDPEEVGDSPYYTCGSEQKSGGVLY